MTKIAPRQSVTVLLALLAGAGVANAAPVSLGYSLSQPATSSAITTIATGSTGQVTVSDFVTLDGNFSVSLAGEAASATSPLLGFMVTVKALNGPGTLFLYASHSLLAPDHRMFLSGFGVDTISSVAALEASYLGGDQVYALDRQLASYAFAPGTPAPSQVSAVASALPDPFTVTELFRLEFTSAGETFSGSQTIQNVVPEPVSLSLLGVGLAGFVAARRYRRKA